MKRIALMLCTAVMCFHHKPFVTFQLANLQNNSLLDVEVNSEAYTCSAHRTFQEFGCLTLGIIC